MIFGPFYSVQTASFVVGGGGSSQELTGAGFGGAGVRPHPARNTNARARSVGFIGFSLLSLEKA
jgi:hypothetical protein